MANGVCFKLDARHHVVVVLLALEATLALVFLIPQVPLFKVEIARCQNCFFKPCWLFGPLFAQISTPKTASQRMNICNKCISRGVMNRLGRRRFLFPEHDAS